MRFIVKKIIPLVSNTTEHGVEFTSERVTDVFLNITLNRESKLIILDYNLKLTTKVAIETSVEIN